MAEGYTHVFSAFQKFLEAEQDLRDELRLLVKNLEKIMRDIQTLIQSVHQPKGLSEIPQICAKARAMFSDVKTEYAALKNKVPQDQYYRFNDHWRYTTQRLVSLAAFLVYLESGKLLQREEAAEILGICVDPREGFHIDLDDFLMGLLLLAEELSRLAVNCVTCGDYERPVQIAQFVTEMNSGFRLLNLKNDMLRKKFDSLKYNLKKVEEVVYDLSIRGLRPPSGVIVSSTSVDDSA